MVRFWFVMVVVAAVACGHSTPSTRESAAGSAGPAQVGSASETGSADQPTGGSDAVTAGSGAPHGDEAHGDEPHYQPIDMKVFDARPHGDKLRVRIELPQEMVAGSVDHHWKGVFTRDGKELPGTEFVVTDAIGHQIVVDYAGNALPSQTVRLFHPRS